ncbi:hypothetical protein J6590_057701 [Homalodisca vitripennis]|nr:hypothetical protein J6590_057701 [Homalodisca vitripennis]
MSCGPPIGILTISEVKPITPSDRITSVVWKLKGGGEPCRLSLLLKHLDFVQSIWLRPRDTPRA